MNVEIDGVLYVPVGTFSEEQLEVMANVLKTQDILSKNAINKFIEAFKTISSEDKPKEDTSIESKLKYIPPSEQLIYESSNINKISSDGIIHFKSGQRSKWTLHNAMDIQAMIHGNFDGITKYDIDRFSKRFGISKNLVRRIIYNLQCGELPKWIEEWSLKRTNEIETPKKREIQNNPQKRKESGYGWIL